MSKDRMNTDNELINIKDIYDQLDKLPAIKRMVMATDLIGLCRDVLLVDLATIRRQAAAEARVKLGMKPREIATESGSSAQTVNRLLAEAHMYAERVTKD